MVRSKNLDELIGNFIMHLGNPLLCKQKAGLWQGIESYKDMQMFIMRDVNFTLNVEDSIEVMRKVIMPDVEWSDLHFKERIGGLPINPGESYKIWPYASFKNDDKFLKEDKKFDHSYMERFWPKEAGGDRPDGTRGYGSQQGIRFPYGDYSNVVGQLIDNPLTRQAYLPIFFPEDTGALNSIRVPCTLGYLFEIFNNKLDVTYYIRSCDAYRHLRNDVYLATLLLLHTKEILFNYGNDTIKPGKLIMKIANLHAFENDIYPLTKKELKIKEQWKEAQE